MPVGPAMKELALANKAIAAHPKQWRDYLYHLKRAAALGHPEAQENLASWYLEGLLDEQGTCLLRRSPRTAIKLLKTAAASGNALANFQLAYCHDVGQGVARDPETALALYRKAFRQGVTEAASNAATLCRELRRNRGELTWLRRAAKAGDSEASLMLATKVLEHVRGTGKSEAIITLRRLVRSGDPLADKAMLYLSNAYKHGVGVTKSAARARHWLERSASLGNEEARRRLHIRTEDFEPTRPHPKRRK